MGSEVSIARIIQSTNPEFSPYIKPGLFDASSSEGAPSAPKAKSKPAAAKSKPAAAPKKETAPAPAAPTAGGEKVTAPIPGKVLTINAKVGDKVSTGDLLLVLEAMKMENEIAATADGEVKEILVSEGQAVQTGDALVVIG